jgi:hypothetical protein
MTNQKAVEVGQYPWMFVCRTEPREIADQTQQKVPSLSEKDPEEFEKSPLPHDHYGS